MASGAVRELITKIKFVLDRASEQKVKSAVQGLKKQLAALSGKQAKLKINADTTRAKTAINSLKVQMAALNGKKQTKLKINADTTRATAAISSLKVQLAALNGKTTTTYVQTKQKGASADTVVKGGGGANKANALADNAGTIAATGAAMVAPLALPVNTAMDFEQAMSKVKAITNSTDEDMARLTATARELGASTQYSASEAAAAMSYLGMAGWKTEQIIAGMPGLLDLAAASGEDLARVADIVSDDLTAFKMPAEQAAHMADVMAAASTNANTNVSMMGETFKYAGAIAGSLGYSLEDVAAAAGLMANAGIKSEMAGTALRSIMTRMIKPPKEAAAALEQLGVSATNADGTVKPFREQMIALRNAMKGLTDAQKSEMANSIAGQEAMSGFLAVINASDTDFNKMTAAVDNADGAAAKMAKTMNDNAKGALKAFKSAVEEVEIIVGNTFLKAITTATKSVTKFVQEFGKFAKEHPRLVGGIAAAIAVIGGSLVALGGVGLVISGIVSAFTALAPIFSAIGGAISAVLGVGLAPVLAVLAAIASAIYFVGENWDLVVSWFSPALDSMMEGLESLKRAWEAIQPLIVALTPLIQFLATLIGGVIVGALSIMYRWWAFIFNQIAGLIEWIAGKLGGLGEIIQTLGSGLGGLIDKALQFIGMKGQIEGVNTSVTQRMADAAIAKATGGNTSSSTEQNYTFHVGDWREAKEAYRNSMFVSDYQ